LGLSSLFIAPAVADALPFLPAAAGKIFSRHQISSLPKLNVFCCKADADNAPVKVSAWTVAKNRHLLTDNLIYSALDPSFLFLKQKLIFCCKTP